MKTYRNVDHAVSSAVSVGSVGIPTAAKWQSQYNTGFVESLTAQNDDTVKLSRSDRLWQAAITASAIHDLTGDIQWAAFLAKYSQHEPERISEIKKLADEHKKQLEYTKWIEDIKSKIYWEVRI